MVKMLLIRFLSLDDCDVDGDVDSDGITMNLQLRGRTREVTADQLVPMGTYGIPKCNTAQTLHRKRCAREGPTCQSLAPGARGLRWTRYQQWGVREKRKNTNIAKMSGRGLPSRISFRVLLKNKTKSFGITEGHRHATVP